MAGGSSKKRRRSKSPARSGPTKLVRQLSRTTSVQSENVASSRNRHLNPTPTRNSTPLPTNDDWVFRVKVISSTKDLDNDVFREAIQGLVKICFPSGVLEELGIDVLKQHMQEENAPAENIAKMTEVFRSEMIQRVAYMLAAYLDTPAKVGAGVRSVIEASAKVHPQLGDDLRNVVKSNLDRQQSIADDEVEDDAEQFSDVEPSPPPRKKHKHRQAAKEHRKPRDEDGSDMDIDPPAQVPESNQAAWSRDVNKDNKKISTSWRWDIDPNTFSMDAVPKVFKRTSDLFAYHALPIARDLLTPNATGKEVRLQMQTMLAEMPENDFRKWAASLQKLYEGDEIMLVRVEPEALSDERKRSTATPAPIDVRKRAAAAVFNHGREQDEAVRIASRGAARVKEEYNADLHPTADTQSEPQAPENDGMATATAAFRRLSTEEGDERLTQNTPVGTTCSEDTQIQPQRKRLDGLIAPGMSGTGMSKSRQSKADIVDLIWPGAWDLDTQDRACVVKNVMDGINKRVSINFIDVTRFDGTTYKQTKADLRSLLHSIHAPGVKGGIERKLTPWFVANSSAFPELVSKPIFFANLMPYITPVLNLLCGSRTPIDESNSTAMKNRILTALRKRGLSGSVWSGPWRKPIEQHISDILGSSHGDANLCCGLLERHLRHVALSHKHAFPELRTSALVKVWERDTGLKW